MRGILTLFLIFGAVVAFIYPTHYEKEQSTIKDISFIYLNSPNDFTILYMSGDKIKQNRFENTELRLCDGCRPYIEITIIKHLNFLNMVSDTRDNEILYIPSLVTINDGGKVKLGKNSYSQNHLIYGE